MSGKREGRGVCRAVWKKSGERGSGEGVSAFKFYSAQGWGGGLTEPLHTCA